jgi:hypothetical protein
MRHEKLITREDKVIRLITNVSQTLNGEMTFDTFAGVKKNGDEYEDYVYFSPTTKSFGPGINEVEDYIQRGRTGLLAIVRPSEILSLQHEAMKLFLGV